MMTTSATKIIAATTFAAAFALGVAGVVNKHETEPTPASSPTITNAEIIARTYAIYQKNDGSPHRIPAFRELKLLLAR